ncbi:unnamed protein product [Clavelina lepadiformis]|uniref:Uncharacterized protein n=1 Tax=Clavelina lepadiformis TaxID=159417 RepID=A0ABP0FDJ5_CLALP
MVQRPNGVADEKGVKQVGAITSGERGKLVTVTVAVSANNPLTSSENVTSTVSTNLSVERPPDGLTRSPQMILPYAKAQPWVKKQSSRKHRSAVVTSTPEKKLEEVSQK